MARFGKLIWQLLICLFLFSDSLPAVLPQVDDFSRPDLMHGFEVWADHSGQLAFEKISLSQNENFVPAQSTAWAESRGKKTAFWFRFRLQPVEGNQIEKYFFYFENQGIASVDFFCPSKKMAGYVHQEAGWAKPAPPGQAESIYRYFSISSDYDENLYFYVRVQTPYSLNLGPRLVSERVFWQQNSRLQLLLAVIAGVLLAMFIYNLVLFIYLKDRQYLLYIFYIFLMFVYQSTTSGLMHLISIKLESFLLRYLLVTVALAGISMLVFAQSFLSTRIYAMRLHLLLYLLMIPELVILFCGQWGYLTFGNQLAVLTTLVLAVVMIATNVRLLQKGFRPALYFLLGWLVLAVGFVSYSLRMLGYLPSGVLTNHAVFFATGIESIILTFALGDRLRLLQKERRHLLRKEHYLWQLSIRDALTNLYNRRYFSWAYDETIARAKNLQASVSAILIDIDHFKKYNDTYGHPAGDLCLKKVANLISGNTRPGDIIARYGGEEFICLLPNTSLAEAEAVAERVRQAIENATFDHPGLPGSHLTISLGVATLPASGNAAELVTVADRCLYRAKKTGRNRVVSSQIEKGQKK